MNLSTAIMLVNESVRSVKVSYDTDYKNNNPNYFFKTLDPDLRVDDYVVVPTDTRHGMTVCKVTEIDFIVDFNAPNQYRWIVGKVDKAGADDIIKQEEVVLAKIAKAEENKMRAELRANMNLGDISFTDLDIVHGTVALPNAATPRGAGNVVEPHEVSAPQPE